MISMEFARTFGRALLAGGAVCLAFAFTASGQVETTTKSAVAGAATHSVKVERGTVVYVSGNSVVIKAEDGTLRHFDNVPDSVTVNVGGKPMKLFSHKVAKDQSLTLGSNAETPGAKESNMYIVFVVGE